MENSSFDIPLHVIFNAIPVKYFTTVTLSSFVQNEMKS